MEFFLVFISVLLGFMRVAGLHGAAYQAFAHLWTGFLVGVAWGVWSDRRDRILAAVLFVLLTALEVACFLLGVGG
jgi:hypothetical protein